MKNKLVVSALFYKCEAKLKVLKYNFKTNAFLRFLDISKKKTFLKYLKSVYESWLYDFKFYEKTKLGTNATCDKKMTKDNDFRVRTFRQLKSCCSQTVLVVFHLN